MEDLLGRLTVTDYAAIGLGFALLIAGRRLYWLALGGTGFFGGLWLAGLLLHGRGLPGVGSGLELGFAFLAGVVGAWLAVIAQRFAIGLAGFVLGGAGALWVASWLDSGAHQGPTPWLVLAAVVGAVLGIAFASALFEASLIAFSSLVGAFLVASFSRIGPPHETWLFLALLTVGVMTQSGRQRRQRRREESD